MGNVPHTHNGRGGNRSVNNSQHKASYEENVPPSARSGINSIHGPNLKGVNRTGGMKVNIQNLNSSVNGQTSIQQQEINQQPLLLNAHQNKEQIIMMNQNNEYMSGQ